MKRLKSEMPPDEPGPIADPGAESDPPEPSSDRMEGVFRALLDWDLRISFRPSPGGRLYTVAKEPEDGDRDELLVDAFAAELVAWVAGRQTRELFRVEDGSGDLDASPTTKATGTLDQRLEAILTRLSGLYLEFHTLRRDIGDLVKLVGETETAAGK